MTLYLDCALRDYYEAGGFENPVIVNATKKFSGKVYVAPLEIVGNSFEKDDEKFIIAAMHDSLLARLPGAKFFEPKARTIETDDIFGDDLEKYIEPAKKSGGKYILAQMLNMRPVRDSRNDVKRITLEEMICDLKGFPLSMQTSSATTDKFTALGAAIFARENLHESREKVFAEKTEIKK